MSNKALEEWSERVDFTLPMKCPNCNKSLNQIKYSYNRDETNINLTGAVNQHYYFLAECPHCKYELKRESDGDRFIR